MNKTRTVRSHSFIQNSLPDGLTRYITDGGAVSAPSENLGFYFSGVHGQNWGVITDDDNQQTLLPTL